MEDPARTPSHGAFRGLGRGCRGDISKARQHKILRILTNDLESPAQEIADLCKRRRAIELFFRWVKQTLKITRFLGTSENAVRVQVAVAMIAFLLLRLAQRSQTAVKSPLLFLRPVRANLMHRRGLAELPHPPGRPGRTPPGARPRETMR